MTNWQQAITDRPPEGADPESPCTTCRSTRRVLWYAAHPNDQHKPYCQHCLWLRLTGPNKEDS